MEKIVKEQSFSWFKKLGRTKKLLKVGEISAKNYILTVQEKQRACKYNKASTILEMTPWKTYLEAH